MEQLLQRYIRGEVSEEERLKVASWLDESPENMREFLALRKLYVFITIEQPKLIRNIRV